MKNRDRLNAPAGTRATTPDRDPVEAPLRARERSRPDGGTGSGEAGVAGVMPSEPPPLPFREEAGEETGSGPAASGHALILANRLPFPVDDGWKVRAFHVVRGVARHVRSTLVAFHPGGDAATIGAAAEALGPGVRLVTVEPPRPYTFGKLLRGLLTRTPVHVWNQESASMRRAVRAILAGDPADVVVAESTFMARYVDLVPGGIPVVVDTHNIDSVTFGRYVRSLPAGLRRWYARATVKRLEGLEAATYARADAVWVCSDVERPLVEPHLGPGGGVRTVPNGVDTSWFAPIPGLTPVPARLLFFGRLDYYPNVDGLLYFAREILPRLEATAPGLELVVVGASPATEIVALARSNPAIRLIGHVPDLRPEIARAAAVVVPLRVGGGTRLKILEALAMARPVVSTSIGAEGLDVRDGRDLMLADGPERFASAVRTLLEDPALGGRLGASGRSLVRDRYDWARVQDLIVAGLRELRVAARP